MRTHRAVLILLMLALCGAPGRAAAGEPEARIQKLVNDAAALLQEKGEAAFAEFRKQDSQWLNSKQSIFVFDETGLELVNGASPELEGRNLRDYQDPSGRYVVREEIAAVKKKGPGWITVTWPRPGDKKPAQIRCYLKGVTVGGKLLIVGSGYYPKKEKKARPPASVL